MTVCDLSTRVPVNVLRFLTLAGVRSRDELLQQILSNSEGNTGETCRGLVRFLNASRLPITIFEQHGDMLGPKYRDELEWFYNTLAAMGFSAGARLYTSSDYQAPTTRVRTYGVIIEFRDMGLTQRQASDLVGTILQFVTSLASKNPRPLEEYLLEPKSPILMDDLQNLEATKKKDKEQDIDDVTWRSDLKVACDKHKILPSSVMPRR